MLLQSLIPNQQNNGIIAQQKSAFHGIHKTHRVLIRFSWSHLETVHLRLVDNTDNTGRLDELTEDDYLQELSCVIEASLSMWHMHV